MAKSSLFRHILALELNSTRKTIFLDKNAYSIGRNSINSLVIHHRLVSRNHANLLRVSYQKKDINNNDIFWLIDGDLKGNRSTNGIYVNGKKCLSQELKPGDLIFFGGVEVKAKYDIVDTNTKVFLSLLTQEENNQINDKNSYYFESFNDEDKATYVAIDQGKKEPLTSEFITKINSVEELLSLPIIEVNLNGEITFINTVAQQVFPDIQTLKLNHIILQNINQIFAEKNTYLLVRDIEINQNKFTQYAYYSKQDNCIKNYVLDIQQCHQFNLRLKEEEQRYDDLTKQISEGIFFVDIITKKIIDANSAYCDLLGYSLDELLQLNIYDIVPTNQDLLQKDFEKIIDEKIPFIRESIHLNKNDNLINVEVGINLIVYGAKEVFCFTVRDITERKRTEEILRYQTCHDSLTNLPNQKLFYDQLNMALNNAKSTGEKLALIFIKLDRFQNINSIFGHNIGDKLLKSFVKKIKFCISAKDVFARWGGDEFVLFIPEIDSDQNIINLCETILTKIKDIFIIDNHKVYLNLKMGISLFPKDGKNATILLKNAYATLDKIQEEIGSKYLFFESEMIKEFQANLILENKLDLAIKKDKLKLFYQPQINVKTGEILEFEVIVKWEDSKLGNIPFDKFFSVAQKSGLMLSLNYWILEHACKQNIIWQKQDLLPIKIGVPLYASCLQDEDFLNRVSDILKETQLNPSLLNLLIQDTNILQNWDYFSLPLQGLLEMGINISIDNFGDANLSLNCLKNFSFHQLKFAPISIQNLDQEPENLAIISAIINLALSLNMTIVSKGVISLRQMELLVNLQCEQMQGSLFSNPLERESATEFLAGLENNLTKIIHDKLIFDLLSIK